MKTRVDKRSDEEREAEIKTKVYRAITELRRGIDSEGGESSQGEEDGDQKN